VPQCNKPNHFAKLCRSVLPRKTDAVEQTEQFQDPGDLDDGESLFIDAIKNDTNNDCYTTLTVEITLIKTHGSVSCGPRKRGARKRE